MRSKNSLQTWNVQDLESIPLLYLINLTFSPEDIVNKTFLPFTPFSQISLASPDASLNGFGSTGPSFQEQLM